MGQVFVNIEVGYPDGGDMIGVPEVLVDTGATHTVLPESVLYQLHVEPKDFVNIGLVGQEEVKWGNRAGQYTNRRPATDVGLSSLFLS